MILQGSIWIWIWSPPKEPCSSDNCCCSFKILIWSNQIFYYTCCITPKRVTSLRGPSPRNCARVTQLLLKKCRSGGETLATLCPIWKARDLNLRSPAPETNALLPDQPVGVVLHSRNKMIKPCYYFWIKDCLRCSSVVKHFKKFLQWLKTIDETVPLKSTIHLKSFCY